jgi:hypothetical protein
MLSPSEWPPDLTNLQTSSTVDGQSPEEDERAGPQRPPLSGALGCQEGDRGAIQGRSILAQLPVASAFGSRLGTPASALPSPDWTVL